MAPTRCLGSSAGLCPEGKLMGGRGQRQRRSFTLGYTPCRNPIRIWFSSMFDQLKEEYGSSKAAMELSEFVRCPVKVKRCAGRIVQTELVVQIDQREIVPGDIIIFEPGDLFPGHVRLLSSKHRVVSQASLTGESWTTEKTADIKDDQSTPLLDLRNICFMIAIPWDKMDEDYVKVPQRWSKQGLPMFILWNGPVCTLFDVTTLLFLWFYYKADSSEDLPFFHSAWFIGGLLMQTLIIHLIRTEKIPFIQEFASWPVLCSTVIVSAIGIAIPFTPIGDVMGFVELPLTYFGFLVVLFIGYFVVGQVVKRLYILVHKSWL